MIPCLHGFVLREFLNIGLYTFNFFADFADGDTESLKNFCRLIYTVFLLSKQVEILVIKGNSVLIY